ncbi:MAG: pentapeptide repeat-containing protein [Acaryochloridaceae cyanobacterium RU_4_10]|nr:pentapeptide repeat-containing protein [Acaryochloridaceae cyanobacterium RU_4_10]
MTRGVFTALGAIAVAGLTMPAIAQTAPTPSEIVRSKSCKGCDLSNANLSGLDLSGANLSGANLSNANLSNTNLSNADLSGAIFAQANLTNAVLTRANLSSVNLQDANLTGANLGGANLLQATLPSNVITPQSTEVVPSFPRSPHSTRRQIAQAPAAGEGAELVQNPASDLSTPKPTDLAPSQISDTAPNNETPKGGAETASEKPTPLELPPIRLFNLETANQLPRGAISFSVGVRNFLNGQGPIGGGLGRQVNNFRIDVGVTKRLQLGLSGDLFSDSLERPVNGQQVRLKTLSGAAELKYQVFKTDKLAVGVLGSAEFLNIRTDRTSFLSGTPLTTGFSGRTIFAGSLQVPLTYSLNNQFQVHLTPGVAFFPDTLKGSPFYGTVFNIGAGVSWQPLKRLNFFADVRVPLGPGGNSIRASNASVFKSVVWSGGFRYLVNPAAAIDIYATNAFGTTPATQVLSFLPDGDQVAIAAVLNFTPDIGQNYAADFRNKPRVALTPRDKQLLLDGLTIPTADTLLPRTLRVRGGAGAGSGGSIATGLTNDVQIELLVDKFDSPGNGDLAITPLKVGAAAKIRFLDQVQGDPFHSVSEAPLNKA